MYSTTKIDWFTGVSRYARTHPFPLSSDVDTFVPCSGWAGYDVGERGLDTGVKRYSSTSRQDMGYAVLISATALSSLERASKSPSLLQAMFDTGLREYRCSRLDLAVDIYDGGLLAQKTARAARRQVIKTSARQVSVIEGVVGKGGVTTYIGTRQSARFIRVYDKAVESNGRVPTSRFELQANKDFANVLWRQIATPTQEALNGVAYAAINGLVTSWGDESIDEQLQFIISAKPAPQPPPKDDAWEWIERQVLPSIQRDWYESDDRRETLLAKLIAAVRVNE